MVKLQLDDILNTFYLYKPFQKVFRIEFSLGFSTHFGHVNSSFLPHSVFIPCCCGKCYKANFGTLQLLQLMEVFLS